MWRQEWKHPAAQFSCQRSKRLINFPCRDTFAQHSNYEDGRCYYCKFIDMNQLSWLALKIEMMKFLHCGPTCSGFGLSSFHLFLQIFSPRSPRSSQSLYPTVSCLERSLRSSPPLDSPRPTPLSQRRCAAMSWPVPWKSPSVLTTMVNISAWEVWLVSPTEDKPRSEPCVLTFLIVDTACWSMDPTLE